MDPRNRTLDSPNAVLVFFYPTVPVATLSRTKKSNLENHRTPCATRFCSVQKLRGDRTRGSSSKGAPKPGLTTPSHPCRGVFRVCNLSLTMVVRGLSLFCFPFPSSYSRIWPWWTAPPSRSLNPSRELSEIGRAHV